MSHYYSEKQESRLNLKKIKINIKKQNKNISFELYSGAGVFSKDELDLGTKILIENCIVGENSKILDLGCGYGIIGIALKKLFPKIKLTMCDVNERAVKLTKINLKLNKINDTDVIKSNLFENISGKFDSTIVNPPMHAGKELCFKIIEESFSHLNKNGTLQIVALHNKGGKSLEKKMIEIFGKENTKTIARESGFRVYMAEKDKA